MLNIYSALNEYILAIIIGIVQGVTEFLPISSTAHIILATKVLASKQISLAASNVIQFGTFIAILQYFKEDVLLLVKHVIYRITNPKGMINNIVGWIKGKNNLVSQFSNQAHLDALLAQMAVATTPIILAALLFRKYVEGYRSNLYAIALFLTIGGLIIVLAEIVYKKRQAKEVLTDSTTDTSKYGSNFNFLQTVTVGVFQSIAILPGISRSGATLAGGLFSGQNRANAIRFSFLLSLPAIGISSINDTISLAKELPKGDITLLPTVSGWNNTDINLSIVSIALGLIVAYFVGLLCLRWLLKYLSKNDSRIFIVYRLALVSAILFFLSR